MGRRKYFTDEERKEANKAASRERQKRFRERHKNDKEFKDKQAARKAYQADYRAAHKDEIAAYKAEYRAAHNEEIAAYQADYRAVHKEELAAKKAEFRSTPFGRASHLVDAYRQADRKYNRGECTVTPEWIVDNIFTQPCNYCCETDWTKLGCDRIDNTKPHTPENCVPCCKTCKEKKQKTEYDEFMRRIGKIA